MVVFVGLVAGFVFAAKMLDDYLNEEGEDLSIIGAAAILAVLAEAVAIVLTGFVFAISKAAKKMEGKMKSMYALMGIMSIMIVLIGAIVALIFTIKDISKPKIWASFGVLAACGGLIIALLTLFVLIIKMKQKLNIRTANIWLMASMVAIMTAAMGVIIGALVGINALGVNNAWKALAICGVILGGIIVALGLIVLISKLLKNVKTSSLVMIAVIMVVFVGAIMGIVLAMQMISDLLKQEDNNFETVAWTIGAIALALIVMILAIVGITKILKPQDMGNLIVITVMIGLIGLVILAIAYAFKMLDEITDLGRIVGTIAAIMGIITGIIILLGLFAKIDVKDASFALVALALIAAVIFTISVAFKILDSIGDLGRLVGTIAAVMGIITGIALVLGAISATGYGAVVLWAGIAALTALAGVLVLLATAVAIFAIGVEKVTKSLINLMNETTPDKIKNIAMLGGALMSLAAGTITNAMADFGASLLGLGGAFIDFQAAVIGFKTSALKALGDIVEGIGSFFKGLGEEKEAKAMERKVQAYKDFADAMDKVAKTDQNTIKEIINNLLDLFNADFNESKVETITECLEELISYFTILNIFWKEAGGSFNEMTNFLTKTIEAVSTPQALNGDNYLSQLMKYLEELKTSIEDIGNPVITPVLDLTSFREGMAEIRQAFGQSGGFVANYSAIESANNSRKNINNNPYIGNANTTANNAPINFTNNFTLEDHQFYGVQACRDIFSTLEYAVNSTFTGINNFFADKFGW